MQLNKKGNEARINRIKPRGLTKLIIKIVLIYGTVIILVLLLRQVPLTRAAEELPVVSFCEIMPNPDGTDTKENEYIKLLNNSESEMPLAGWKICNISQDCYTLQESLPAENCNRIYRTSFLFTLHNDKEEISLFDKNNNPVDKITTGAALSGKAWQCFNRSCAWGPPQESCDYSFLIPEEIPAPQENTNSNGNSSEINENSNNNSPAENNQSNNNSNFSNKPVVDYSYPINDTKDFSRLRKILRKEKQISVLVDIKGTVAILTGLMGKTYFYLVFKDELIKTHIYASCQNSPNCLRDIDLKRGKKLYIRKAVLKIIDGRFEIYLNKNTQVEDRGSKKLKSAQIPQNNNNSVIKPSLNKKTGQEIKISGVIVSKKGDYFFVEDRKNLNILSVYVPKSLQNTYAKKLETVPLGYFSFYQESIPNKNWIGGLIEAAGVIEAVGPEYRVLAYELSQFEAKNPAAKSNEKEADKSEKEKQKASTEVTEKLAAGNNSRYSLNNNKTTVGTESQKDAKNISKDKVKEILSQSLSWQSLFSIIANKLVNRISSFRQYF